MAMAIRVVTLLVVAMALGSCGSAPPVPGPPPPAPVPATGGGLLPGGAMLPSDVRLIPPAPGLPPERAALSGRWGGTWDDGTGAHILIVEEVLGDTASVVIATPSAQERPWTRWRGRFEEGALVVDTGAATFRYALQSDDSLAASLQREARTARARLTRQPWRP
jgi:hypothetical protein